MPEHSEHESDDRREMLRSKILGLGERSIRKSYYPELQRRLEELRASEERHRAVFNSTNDAFFIHDPQTGIILDLNPQTETLYGFRREELLGRSVGELCAGTAPYTEADALEKIRRAQRDGQLVFEWRAKRRDGSLFWAEVALCRFDCEEGNRIVAAVRDISHHKEAEQELRRARDFVTQILNNIPQSVFWKDRQCRYLGCNTVFARDVGLENPADIVGMTDFDLPWPVEEAQMYRADDQEVMESGQAKRHIIEPLQQADGMRLWIDTTKVPLMDERGQVFGILGVYEDITERKRAVDAMQKSAVIIDSTSDAVITTDIHGNITLWNRGAERIYGYRQDEVLGKSIKIIHRSEDLPALDSMVAKLLEGETIPAVEMTCTDKGHRDIDILLSMTPIRDDDGRIIELVGITKDIGDRKRAEEALRESEEKYRLLFDSADMMVSVYDHQGVCQLMNRKVAALFGGEPEDFIGKNFRELHPEGADEYIRRTSEAIDTGISSEYEDVVEFPVGTRWLLSRVHPVPDAQGVFHTAQIISQDITERRLAEMERARLEEQYRQAQRIEAIGQLTGGVAHDFNNLLQVINGATDMALEDLNPGHPACESLAEVAKAGNRAARLVSQLLLFSRRQVMRPDHLDLNEIVTDLLKMLGRLIGEHVQLHWHPGPNVGTIFADRSMVEQAIVNLCVNARDAMPEGGTLTIETSRTVVDEIHCATHSWAGPGRYAMLSVSDTGCGMTKDILDHIFEPFFTTKEKGKGTGLGLATVYGIIRQHNGTINVYSEPGLGTVFKLHWPVSETAASALDAEFEASAEGGKETILLAEDDEMVRRLTRTVLERAGYTVLTAENGAEAIAIFEEHRGEIDMAILDVVMPQMGGREARERMLAMRPDFKTVFASGYSEDAIHTNFVLDHGLILIQKPFTREALLRTVRQVLDNPAERDQ